MSFEEETEDGDPHYRAAVLVIISVTSLVLLIPVIIFELLKEQPVRSRDAKTTKRLMIAVISTNTWFQLVVTFKWLFCIECPVLWGTYQNSRALIKGINWMFLIHRAKVAQGMSSVLSRKWFERILPAISAIIILAFMVIVSTSIGGDDQFNCFEYVDVNWNNIKFCQPLGQDDNENSSATRMMAAAAIGFDLLISFGLLTLFVVPLYRVYRTKLGELNENQRRQRLKLKELLIWSVAMTFINQITSTFNMALNVHENGFTIALWRIGMFDPPINAWSSWLMISRNRQHLRQLFGGNRDTIQPAFTSSWRKAFFSIRSLSRIVRMEETRTENHRTGMEMKNAPDSVLLSISDYNQDSTNIDHISPKPQANDIGRSDGS